MDAKAAGTALLSPTRSKWSEDALRKFHRAVHKFSDNWAKVRGPCFTIIVLFAARSCLGAGQLLEIRLFRLLAVVAGNLNAPGARRFPSPNPPGLQGCWLRQDAR